MSIVSFPIRIQN